MVYLIADTREKKPVKAIAKYNENHEGNEIAWRELQIGDYACSEGCCGVERKEADFDDMRDVLVKVSELIGAYEHPYVVVTNRQSDWVDEGSRMFGRSYAARIALLGSLAVQGVPVMWCHSYEYMLDLMHSIIRKHHDGKDRSAARFNHVRHVTHKEVAQNILTSIPGIGPKKAVDILQRFGSVANFMAADEKEIISIQGISIKTCQRILDALNKEV